MKMTRALAQTAVDAALTKGSDLGYSISATVVDESGRMVICVRGDGATFSTTNTSFAKAVAAAAYRRPTKEITESYEANMAFWGNVPHAFDGPCLPSIGAVPITEDGHVIGAIGCAGATGDLDHECAIAGAEGALHRPKP